MGERGGRTLSSRFPKLNRVSPCNNIERRRGVRRQHAASPGCSPRTKRTMRRTEQVEVAMGIDESSGGSDGFQEEMPSTVNDVKSILPYVIFTNERLGKMGAESIGEVMGSCVVGEDVRVGGGEKRGRFKEDDVVGGNEFL